VFYGSEYAGSGRVFVWLSAAAAITFIASFVGTGLTAARHFHVQLPLFLVITVVEIALCFNLVGSDGLMGAAKALTTVAVIQLTLTTIALVSLERHRLAEYL
jgi:O-antigen/teichoic acid export membrane protein